MATPIARITAGSLCAGLLLLAAGCGRDSSAPPSPQDGVREKLRQVVSLWVSDEPLADALTRLGREYGLVIEIDQLATKGTGTEPADLLAEPVSLRVRDIQLGSALHHLLRPLGLTYDLNGPAIHVTTPARLPKLAVGRVHAVADLLGHEVDLDEDDLAKLLREVFPSQPFTPGWPAPRMPSPPDGIVAHPGVLVVARPPLVQEQIVRLFNDMRKLADPSTPPPTPQRTAAESAIDRAWGTAVSVNYRQQPLARALRQLADAHGLNLLVDEEAEIDAHDRELTLQAVAKQTPMRDALRLMLEERALDYVVWHEAVLITFSGDPRTGFRQTALYSLDGLLDHAEGVNEEAICEMVMNNVAPGYWFDAGGLGIHRVVPGGLLVHGTSEVHHETTRTLAQLRRAMDLRILEYEPLPPHSFEAWFERKLAEPTEVKFDKTPLIEVVRYFIRRHDVPILFNRRALEDAGIVPEETLITRQFKNASMRTGLQAVLEEIALDFVIDRSERALVITSKDQVDLFLTTRFYRVGGFSSTVSRPRLIELIQNLVMPDSWGDAGGPGTLYVLGETLIVSQTDRGHHDVGELLDALRRHFVPPPPPEVSVAAWPRSQTADHIERELDEPVAFEFRGMTLSQLVDRLRKEHAMPIMFNRRALEDAGVIPETLITRSSKKRALRFTLSHVLEELGLDFIVRRDLGLLTITSKDDAEQYVTTCFYRVEPLIGQSAPLAPKDLMALIQKTVFVDSWVDRGGPGSMDRVETTLLVSQTDRRHYYVRQFLDALSRFFSDPSAADVPVEAEPLEGMPSITLHRIPPALKNAGLDAKRVGKLIYRQVAPETWEPAGGPGVINTIPGGIVVVNGQPTASETERFLVKLRARFAPAERGKGERGASAPR